MNFLVLRPPLLRLGPFVLGVVWLALLPGCRQRQPFQAGSHEQAYDEIRRIEPVSADSMRHSSRMLPASSYHEAGFRWGSAAGGAGGGGGGGGAGRSGRPTGSGGAAAGAAFVDSTLEQLRLGTPPDSLVHVLVFYTDSVVVPPFPRTNPVLPPGHPDNVAAILEARHLIDSLSAFRSPRYTADTTDLKVNWGAERIIRTFWVTQAVLVEMPIGQTGPLEAEPDVLWARLDIGPPPPVHNTRENDVDKGRARIGTDLLAEMGYGRGRLALIDTGVRSTHTFLRCPRPLCLVENCVDGCSPPPFNPLLPTPCSEFVPCGIPLAGHTGDWGDIHTDGHGTSSAAIIAANGRPVPGHAESGAWYRGVTTRTLGTVTESATIDSYRVYDWIPNPVNTLQLIEALIPSAAVDAFQYAMARCSQVILCETQDIGPEMVGLDQVADQAYGAGFVVIAANGNFVNTGSPAYGRRVMGVGQYNVFDGAYFASGSSGGIEGRLKPDIMLPSHSETADSKYEQTNPALGNDELHNYPGTSGAAPYAAGAALILRNWLEVGGLVDAGQVYAQLIVSGDEVGSFLSTSMRGAGRMKVRAFATTDFGKVGFAPWTTYVDVPIDVPEMGFQSLDAAIWWPESPNQWLGSFQDVHRDLDLQIVRRGILPWWDVVLASSESDNSVFEKVRLAPSVLPPNAVKQTTTQLTLRIREKPRFWLPWTGFFWNWQGVRTQPVYWTLQFTPRKVPFVAASR